MNLLQVLFGFAVIISACAQVSMPPGYKEKYPHYYKFSKQARHPRDVISDKEDNGNIFGIFTNTDDNIKVSVSTTKVWDEYKNIHWNLLGRPL